MNWHIHEAVRHIAQGGVIAYPTETVYGLGCNPLDAAAVLRLLALKQRSITLGVVLIGSDFRQFEAFLAPLGRTVLQRVTRPAARPTTWVLPCRPATPDWLTGNHDTLAVRVTRHPLAAALCERWDGPLVSTSANRHGSHPATSAWQVRRVFNGQLDYIVHGNDGATHTPSTIRDATSGRVLRD